MSGNLREIVNGSLLAHHVGRTVSLTGEVTQIHPYGTSFELKTVDNITVTVNVNVPLDDVLEGYVEVHGKCQTRNTVDADEYIQFSAEQTGNFDGAAHNALCKLLQQIPNLCKTEQD